MKTNGFNIAVIFKALKSVLTLQEQTFLFLLKYRIKLNKKYLQYTGAVFIYRWSSLKSHSIQDLSSFRVFFFLYSGFWLLPKIHT